MRYALTLVGLVAAVQASPVAFPQGVTASIAPKEPAPAGCFNVFNGEFGMQVVPLGHSRRGEPVSVIPDGQPQAPTDHAPPPPVVTVIPDGQPQAPGGQPQAPGGQPQAPGGKSYPAPPGPTPAPGPYPSPDVVTVIPDGQPQAPGYKPYHGHPEPPAPYPAPESYPTPDHCPAPPGPHGPPGPPAPYLAPKPYPAPKPYLHPDIVTVIPDGQPQAPIPKPYPGPPPPPEYVTVTIPGPAPKPLPPNYITEKTTYTEYETVPAPTPTYTTGSAASQIGDGQIQAPTEHHAKGSEVHVNQPKKSEAPKADKATNTTPAASQITDGQAQAPTGSETTASGHSEPAAQAPTGSETTAGGHSEPAASNSTPAASQIGDGQPQGPGGDKAHHAHEARGISACKKADTLTMKLNNGVLTDNKSRTGYIASNFQFQFDGPPQAGALTTAGYSVCEDGNMALGGSKVFYRCRSGNFYNLYDRKWAAHCEAVNFQVVTLEDCA